MHAKSNPVRFRPATARVLAALASCLVLSASAGVFDDAKFILDLRGGENTYSKPGDVGNALEFSAASDSPCVGYMGDFDGAKTYLKAHDRVPQQLETEVVNPYYPATTNTQNALHFYQDTKSSTQSARTSVCISNAAVNASTVTFYVRFKWDGIAPGSASSWPCYIFENGKDGDGNKASGVALSIAKDTSIANTTTNGYLAFRGAAKADNLTTLTVKVGMWNDAFITYTRNSDNTEYTVTGSVCSTSTSKPTLKSQSVSKTGALSFATPNIVLGGYHNTSGGATYTRGFRGVIAEFMAWERALTDDEKLEVMAGPAALGGRWQIGAANGSADEFGDDDPAPVYDVQTMPWRMMRKTLDASNPSLSLAATMTSSERQMERVLTFTPICSVSSAPAEVSLNGTVVGEIDLASEASITLPKKGWLHDGGANTITVTRKTPVSGTVRFDAISLVPAPSAGSVLEDAVFLLDLRGDANANDSLDPGEIGNALDFSAASPSYAFYGEKGVAKPYACDFYPSQTVMRVALPLAAGKTNEQTCVYFPQEPAEKYCGITIPKAAVTGDDITMYVRFRPDGVTSSINGVMLNGFNGWDAAGLGIYYNENYQIGILTPGNAGACNITLTPGEWYDVFVVATNSTDGASTGIGVFACRNGAASFSRATLARTGANAMAIGAGRALTFGSYESNTPSNPRAFRGAIAGAAIWDRALTDDEKRQVMAGSAGAKWFVGVPNGSADEFGDGDPAAVYEPETMPWHRMRKTLDAANPTLSLRCAVAENDVKAAKLLAISPILRGGAEDSCPVAVTVNGTSIGTFDLADPAKRCILVERSRWTPDADGNATVALERTGAIAGTLAIDHLSLCGTWMIGRDDGEFSPMRNQAAVESSLGFVGDTEESRFCASVSVGNRRPGIFLDAWIPEGAEAYDWRFSTDIQSNYQDADQGFSLFVNGTQVGEEWPLPAGNNANEKYRWTIPAGTFAPGVNRLQLKMTTPASGTGWAFLDYYRLQLVEPPSAFVLIVR